MQEVPVARGLASDGKLLPVFASEDGISWTVMLAAGRGQLHRSYWPVLANRS